MFCGMTPGANLANYRQFDDPTGLVQLPRAGQVSESVS
jgi:hypothetical protein